MQQFSQYILHLLGWKSILTVDIPPKCILCVAPHTSNWDFFIGKLYYSSIGKKPYFLMKQEWFFFPLKYLLKGIGGFPVNRKSKTSLTAQMTEEFNKRSNFQLAVAPEGTRKRNANWKSGFYYIALKANDPIILAHIDYSKKEVGITQIFHPTGNEIQDMEKIKQFYKGFQGLHPEKFAV